MGRPKQRSSGARPEQLPAVCRLASADPIKKDKLFFFLSYEGLHSKSTTYGQSWVTTPQYRQLMQTARAGTNVGKIFSESNANPRIVQVLNADCSIFGSNASTNCRQVPGGLDVGSPGRGRRRKQSLLSESPGCWLDRRRVRRHARSAICAVLPSCRADRQSVQWALRLQPEFEGYYLGLGLRYALELGQRRCHVGWHSEARTFPSSRLIPQLQLSTSATSIRPPINELRGNFTRFADNQLNDTSGMNWGIPRIQVEGISFRQHASSRSALGPRYSRHSRPEHL